MAYGIPGPGGGGLLRNGVSTYRFNVYTILPSPISYGVWHKEVGGRWGGLLTRKEGRTRRKIQSQNVTKSASFRFTVTCNQQHLRITAKAARLFLFLLTKTNIIYVYVCVCVCRYINITYMCSYAIAHSLCYIQAAAKSL